MMGLKTKQYYLASPVPSMAAHSSQVSLSGATEAGSELSSTSLPMVSQLFNHVGRSCGRSCVLHGGLGQALAWSQSDPHEVAGPEISMFKYDILVHFHRNPVQLVWLLLAPVYSLQLRKLVL